VFSDLYGITVPRLYSTLHTQSGPYRLWSSIAAHELQGKRTTVSEGATMQHPVYGLPRIPLPRIPVHKPRICFAVIAGSSCFATLPSHAASGRRAEILYRVAFEGANFTKMSLVMATAGWTTICCSRCCGSTTRIVRVTVVAAAGFG
jgi:hypothetical protein